MNRTLRALAIAAAAAALLPPAADAVNRTYRVIGVAELPLVRLPARSGGPPVDVAVLTPPAGGARAALVFVPQAAAAGGQALSVRALVGTPLAGGAARRAVVSGGFSASRVEIPLGLLVVDGRLVSRLNETPARPVAGCAVIEKYRFAGVLCRPRAGAAWTIIKAEHYGGGACADALQAGPLLVSDGANAVCESEPMARAPYERMVACLTAGGALKFVHAAAVNLRPLAAWLAAPPPAGLGCRSALNLAGDTSAGIAYFERAGAAPQFIGAGAYPLASAILLRW